MKIIVFDFDGTLTEKHSNTWKFLWSKIKFGKEINDLFYELYRRKKITYEKWASLDFAYFKKSGINANDLADAVENTKLMSGCLELFKYLKYKGIEIHIVSGGIKQVILPCLGDCKNYCTKIEANDFKLDKNGNLKNIVITPYDNEGKALYVEQVIKNNNLTPNDILFVGNSENDEFVHKTGCKTLCINPDNANSQNKAIWNITIETNNLLDLIPIIDNLLTEQEEK